MDAETGDSHAGFQTSEIAPDGPTLPGTGPHGGEEAEDGLVGMGRMGVSVLGPLRGHGHRGKIHESEREVEFAQQKLGSAVVEIGWSSG